MVYVNMAIHAIEVKTPFKTVNELDICTIDSDMSTDFEIIKITHTFSR